MTGGTGVEPQDQVEARPSSSGIARTVLRVAGSVAALVTLYYLLPLDHSSTPAAVTMLVIGLAAFIALVAAQVRWIIRSPFSALPAVESLATSVPLFIQSGRRPRGPVHHDRAACWGEALLGLYEVCSPGPAQPPLTVPWRLKEGRTGPGSAAKRRPGPSKA
jgi:hypothetical protein